MKKPELTRRTALGSALGLGAIGVAAAAGGARWIQGPGPASAASETFPVTRTKEEWRRLLTPAQFKVLREEGTERAFTSPLDTEKRAGRYHCAGCDNALFESRTKYDSGTGWPSFYEPLPGAVGTRDDISWLGRRTEVHCARCGGHLGHVFNDGPKPTGLRYCMNGVAMSFKPAGPA